MVGIIRPILELRQLKLRKAIYQVTYEKVEKQLSSLQSNGGAKQLHEILNSNKSAVQRRLSP